MRRALVLLAAVVAVTAVAAPVAQGRERWDTRLLALVPPPGYPAHAYVHPDGRVYAGTYVNPGSQAPSRVIEYTSGEGQLLRSWEVAGQELDGDHGVQVATSDALGRLVLLSHAPGRVLLLDRRTGEQMTYAEFPRLGGTEAVPNYAAWGPDGSLYVTDYANNVVWRVPPGGGTAELWLQAPELQTIEFGTTGIELAADRRTLLVAQQTSPASGNPLTGGLFAVPIGDDGKPGPVRRIWESGLMDLPDGLAIAESGRIYVAALGPNQITVLDPAGRELERFPETPLLGDNGSSTPFDTLSSVGFLGTRLITASQSNPRGEPDHWALHDVETGEPGLPELIPANAGLRPGEQVPAAERGQGRIALRIAPRRVRAGRRVRFTFRATEAGDPVAGALIRFAGRRARTDAAGRTAIAVRLQRPGLRRALATRGGFARGTAAVRVLPAR